VIYEDNHLIAVNKPAGYLVHGDATGDTPLTEYVKAYIKVRYKKPGAVFLGVIHRLDRPVSGTILFARTSKALSRMAQLFKDKAVEKKYWAVTKARPNPISGTLKHYLLKDHSKNVTKAYQQIGKRTSKAKLAELSYELISEIDHHYLVEVRPITGRPHQIRVQLASIDCPIIGDVKYGFRKGNENGSIHLHCREMSFIHPVKKEKVTIGCQPPEGQIWNRFVDD
ncbi:MAG: RNA pseudouridine synthase, partial [Bacteroidota bacterium]